MVRHFFLRVTSHSPVRVLCPELLLFFCKFFAREMGRHTDAAVFGKNAGLKTSLRFARVAGAIEISIAVMVDLREILLFCVRECLMP